MGVLSHELRVGKAVVAQLLVVEYEARVVVICGSSSRTIKWRTSQVQIEPSTWEWLHVQLLTGS